MIELLHSVGLPAIYIVLVVIAAAVLNRYYQHRLEMHKEMFAKQMELIQSIHSQRFDATKQMARLLGELDHGIYHVQEGHTDYKARVERCCKALREFVRENTLILGNAFQPAVYALTDAARAVGTEEFDKDRLWELERTVLEMQNQLLRTIPNLPRDISAIPPRHKGS